jgi:hypothetical protein
MADITLTVDGKEVTVPQGESGFGAGLSEWTVLVCG